MDIALLSKMVRELILDHDEVGLPGLGTLVAEMVPAAFSDRGYTINPPYRRVAFIPGQVEDDSLVRLYAGSLGISLEQADAAVRRFVAQLKARLMEEKTLVFPGLGRLRSTRQNHLFFISDEDLDIYPDGFGLPSVSLKNHPVQQEELHAAVQELASIVEGAPVAPAEALDAVPAAEAEPEVEEIPLIEEAVEPEAPAEELSSSAASLSLGPTAGAVPPLEPRAAMASEDTPSAVEPAEAPAAAPAEPAAPKVPRRRSRWWIVPVAVVALAAVALAAFVVLAHAAPDFIDTILYTPEELGIINY